MRPVEFACGSFDQSFEAYTVTITNAQPGDRLGYAIFGAPVEMASPGACPSPDDISLECLGSCPIADDADGENDSDDEGDVNGCSATRGEGWLACVGLAALVLRRRRRVC